MLAIIEEKRKRIKEYKDEEVVANGMFYWQGR